MRAILGSLLAGPLLLGCLSIRHSSRNAPGNIVVEEPPRNLRQQTHEVPSDPGEHVLLWSAGVLGGGGLRLSSDHPGLGSVSAETSLRWGWSEHAHSHDGMMPFLAPNTTTSFGVNLGWTLGTEARPASNAGYAELQVSRRDLFSLAGGWSWDPLRHLSGPQLTGSVGPLYVRSSTLLTSGTSLEIGVVLKLPLIAFTELR